MRKVYSCGVIPVYLAANSPRYLVIQHQSLAGDGHWSFPKGHADPGELPIETARREFEEETGIRSYQLRTDRLFTERYVSRERGQAVDKKVTYYLGVVFDPATSIQAGEIAACEWLEYEQALERITFPRTAKLLTSAHRLITDLERVIA